MRMFVYFLWAFLLLQKLTSFSWEKSIFSALRATYTSSPSSFLKSFSLFVYSVQLAVFHILFRGQNKVRRNLISAWTCSLGFGKGLTFGEFYLAQTTAYKMRQKGNPFTALSSTRIHSTHIPCCILVLWYQFYLPFNPCNWNICSFLVPFSSLAKNNPLPSHRNMRSILLSNLRRKTGLNSFNYFRVVCIALWAGCNRSTSWAVATWAIERVSGLVHALTAKWQIILFSYHLCDFPTGKFSKINM